MEVLTINGIDYGPHIEVKGVGWSRNDVDSEKTTRTKDGRLRRDKITTKRKLSFKLTHMTREQLARLDEDLSSPTFSAAYLDLHGVMQREFYCSSFSATIDCVYDAEGTWSGAAFDMIEV